MVVHAIQSIIDKMRPGDELIVVDHGSDDGSIEQVKQFSEKKIASLSGKEVRIIPFLKAIIPQ